MRADQFITEAQDSDAVNELDLYIMNNEELYRRRFMPIIENIKRKIKRGIYDHEKVIKMWMYLVDDAAREYVKEFGDPTEDVKDMFPKETRLKVAQIIADREKENIEKGEYDVVKGTVTQRGR
jgi:uridine kinase